MQAPGPGHYQHNIQNQLKLLTDRMTPRYKQNPFGSNISRFDPKSKDINKPTEEETRVKELIRDLEEHTSLRPAVTGKPIHAPSPMHIA